MAAGNLLKKISIKEAEKFFISLPYDQQRPIQSRMIEAINKDKLYPISSQRARKKLRDDLLIKEVTPLMRKK